MDEIRGGGPPGDELEQAGNLFRFLSFELVPDRRLLFEAGQPVVLGSRALEILLILVSNAGQLVTKDILLKRVWPGVMVEDGTLRVHVAALRKALGDGRDARRLIVNTPGRGYTFVVPVTCAPTIMSMNRRHGGNDIASGLPGPLKIIGRSTALESLTSQLSSRKLLTIVGPGGIGKTTLALAAARQLRPLYADGVKLVDFAPLGDAALAATVVATALGLTVNSTSAVFDIARFLKSRDMLLVLDNCEHVIDAAAGIVQQIRDEAPDVHIIATSREALRVRGEHVFRLASLDTPRAASDMTATEALQYSAVELFVDRACANLDSFQFSDADAPVVGEICRRLDGIALAIELAAGRVDTFGVRGVAAQLDDRFKFLTRGARTAKPHHQTLIAAFDWSYLHLPERSRAVFRRLAVFAGKFSMEAAQAVASHENLSTAEVSDEIANLVATSLVAADVSGEAASYRLLESTRVYARDRLSECGELDAWRRRHADYVLHTLVQINSASKARTAAASIAAYRPLLDDVRTALNWTLVAKNDPPLGIRLTAAAGPLWYHLSLDEECQQRTRAAIAVLEPVSVPPDRLMMELSCTLGTALIYMEGGSPKAIEALSVALEIAEALGDVEFQLRTLRGLWSSSYGAGRFAESTVFAKKFATASLASPAVFDHLLATRMRGMEHFHRGELREAHETLAEAMVGYADRKGQVDGLRFQLDQRMVAGTILATTLWLQGFPVKAEQMASQSIQYALEAQHDQSLMSALSYVGCRIPIITGDFELAEQRLATLNGLIAMYPPNYFGLLAEGWLGVLLARKSDFAGALHALGSALDRMPVGSLALHYTRFLGEHAHLLAQSGDFPRGQAEIETALRLCEELEERWFLPELVRLKGEIVLIANVTGGQATAEALFERSLEMARGQGALSWELRTAMSLARLWTMQGRKPEGLDLLRAVYARFTEGFSTTDLLAAKSMLETG